MRDEIGTPATGHSLAMPFCCKHTSERFYSAPSDVFSYCLSSRQWQSRDEILICRRREGDDSIKNTTALEDRVTQWWQRRRRRQRPVRRFQQLIVLPCCISRRAGVSCCCAYLLSSAELMSSSLCFCCTINSMMVHKIAHIRTVITRRILRKHIRNDIRIVILVTRQRCCTDDNTRYVSWHFGAKMFPSYWIRHVICI